MSLLDILNGIQTGPGREAPAGRSGSGSALSPIMIALLGLLASRMLGGQQQQQPSGGNTSASGGLLGELLGGDLGGLLKGGLGGLLAGGAGGSAGGVLSGGLGDLMKQFEQAGQGDAVKSWVGTGANQPIGLEDLAKAIGPDRLGTLSQQSGLSQNDLLAGLSQHLPEFINQLTPDGRLPTDEEFSRNM
ncbi:YidB family protein [Reyranella sp.]|uniref:YidB family protein n=1 Tax=Reyranella sp. TaxID=1929291 RepID=UPI0012200981|nr:YidB family protein [Reyranella sp.]TAJ87100.1 MAG: DUF937 domain-containing protein [Reyranella sp.]